LKSRTNTSTLASSKFHRSTTESHWHILFLCFSFSLASDLAGGHYARLSRSDTYRRGMWYNWRCDGIIFWPASKGTGGRQYSFCLSTIYFPVMKKFNVLEVSDPLTNPIHKKRH